MAETAKQKVPQKNIQADKTRVAVGYDRGTSEWEGGTAVVPKPPLSIVYPITLLPSRYARQPC